MGRALMPKWARERGIRLARGTHTVRISCPFCTEKVKVTTKTKRGEIFTPKAFTCPYCDKWVSVKDIINALSRARAERTNKKAE